MSTNDILNEAAGYLNLEDIKDAEEALDKLSPEQRELPESKWMRMHVEMAKGNFSGAVQFATDPEINEAPHRRIKTEHCMSLAGNHRAAYESALASEQDNEGNPLYWFNRACYASLCGEFVDAVNSLGRCFLVEEHLMTDAFLEPDLAGMWEYLEELEPSFEDSEFLLFPGWSQAIQRWETRQDPMVVPIACKEHMPEQLHAHVVREYGSEGFKIAKSAPLDIQKQFEDWKWGASEKNVIILRDVLQRARFELLKAQAKLAFDQALAGNFTAARFHMTYLLAMAPDYPVPPFFQDVEFLRIFLADIENAMNEDAGFCGKIEQVRFALEAENLEAGEDILDSITPEGRKTNLYALRLCNFEQKRGRAEAGLEIAVQIFEKWPFEISALKVILEEAIRHERWEMAEQLLDQAHPSLMEFNAFEAIKKAVAQREPLNYEGFVFPFQGQRHLGMQLRPEAALRAEPGPFIITSKLLRTDPSVEGQSQEGAAADY